MRRMAIRWLIPFTIALTGCAAKLPSVNVPVDTPTHPAPEAPVNPPTLDPTPPKPAGPAVLQDGSGFRLVGDGQLGQNGSVDWSPSGHTALVYGTRPLHRLRLDARELRPVPELRSAQNIGWTGPDTALLIQWSGEVPTVGELALLTGDWRPLARVSASVAICQSGDHWVWVDIKSVMQGAGPVREIGTVYRTPVPDQAAAGSVKPLEGAKVLERGALLGRLADGSCLLDGMDRRLLLLRPNGDLQTISNSFALPEVTRDGRGVVWREKAGDCPECIELGPGVPFQRLTWWRLDGMPLTADLGSPQVMTCLLSPDGQQLLIGHRAFDTAPGAISVLSPEGFQPGKVQARALAPAGWMGSHLLTQPAGPERWTDRSPIYDTNGAQQVGEWLSSGVDGSLLIRRGGELMFLTPDGSSYRLSHPDALLKGTYSMGVYNPQAPYVTVRQADGLLLVKLEQ